MINLFKQFFSFEKLMKDRLVKSFFFLGLVVIGLKFFGTIMLAFGIMNHSFLRGLGVLIVALFQPLFLFVGLRLVCELMVALFEINDNLAPDGGKSNTADIDVFETAKDAASKAAHSASTATKSVVDKTKTKINERKDATTKDTGADDYADYEDTPPPKPIVKKTVRKRTVKKAKPAPKVYTKKPAAKKTAKKATPKKTVRKPTVKKTTAKKKPATKK